MFAKYRNDKLVIIDSMTMPKDCFEVSNTTIGGFSKEYYNDDYSLKDTETLVNDGVMELTETQKIVDNRITDKTDLELMTDGLKDVPTGFMLLDGELVAKNLDEKLADKELTQDEYDVLKKAEKNALIVAGIREVYSINEEAKCLREGILDATSEDFIEYNKTVLSIKTKYAEY